MEKKPSKRNLNFYRNTVYFPGLNLAGYGTIVAGAHAFRKSHTRDHTMTLLTWFCVKHPFKMKLLQCVQSWKIQLFKWEAFFGKSVLWNGCQLKKATFIEQHTSGHLLVGRLIWIEFSQPPQSYKTIECFQDQYKIFEGTSNVKHIKWRSADK